MTDLIRTKNAAWYYLVGKRNEISCIAQQAEDLHNADGAEMLRHAVAVLKEITDANIPAG